MNRIEPDRLLAHTGWIRALALELVGEVHRAEDVVQETWLAALRNPPDDGGDERNLRAWLARVVRNVAGLSARRDGRRNARERASARPEVVPSVAEAVERVAVQRELVDAVMGLSSPDRELVVLRWFEELPPREIARRMGMSGPAVRSRLSRALEKLRARLDDEHGGDRSAWSVVLLGLPAASKLGAASIGIAGGVTLKGIVELGVASAIVACAVLAWRGWGELGSDPVDGAVGPADGAAALASPPSPVPDGPAADASPEPGRESVASAAPVAAEREGAAVALEATVVDPVGRPLPGVRFALDGVERDATSDANGNLRLELPWPIEPTCGKSQWGSLSGTGLMVHRQCFEVPGPGEHFLGRIQLDPGGAVAGRVVRPDGSPVVGVRVDVGRPTEGRTAYEREALRIDGGHTYGPVARHTDESGRYRLEGVPATRLSVFARADGTLYHHSPAVAVPVGGEARAEDLVLEPAGPENRVAGRVLAPDGTPVERAYVTIEGDGVLRGMNSFRYTDADGRFEFLVARDRPHSLLVTDRSERRWGLIELDGVEGGSLDLELRFQERRWIEVTAVDAGGGPVDGLWLSYAKEAFLARHAAFEPLGPGRARVPLPAEPFVLGVGAPGFLYSVQGPFEPSDPPAELVYELVRSGGVGGRVHFRGEPVAGARVHAHRGDERLDGYGTWGPGLVARHRPRASAAVTTDGDGRFFLPIYEAGEWHVHVEKTGFARADAGAHTLDVGQSVTGVDAVLAKGGAIEGRLLAAEGVDVRGATIAATSGDGHSVSARADEEGRFRLESLTPGPWQLLRVADRDAHQLRSLAFSGRRGDAVPEWDANVVDGATVRVDIDLRHETPASIEGTLLIGGEAPTGTLWLADADERVMAQLSSDGRFSASLREPGEYHLSLAMGDHRSVSWFVTARVELVSGPNEWRLELPAGRVELTGLDLPASRDPGKSIHEGGYALLLAGGEADWYARLVAAEDGRVVLEHVPAGDYELRRDSGGREPFMGWPVVERFRVVDGDMKTVTVVE